MLLQQLQEAGYELPSSFTLDLIEKVQNIISKCESTGLGRQSGWEEVQKILFDEKLGWYGEVPPEWVACHPANRSSTGVGGSEAQVHGWEILKSGFSLKKASDATAFQALPEHLTLAKEMQEQIDKSIKISNGLIPPLQKTVLMSVGSGHTNTFLRQINAGVKSVVKDMGDEAGNLNAEILCRGRPQLAQALSKGLTWYQMHWGCQLVWPKLATMVEQALNTDARKGKSEIETMLYIHQKYLDMKHDGKKPCWDEIEQSAKASLPACAGYIGALTAYVQKNSGGSSGELLQALNDFSKVFGCQEHGTLRNLGGEYINAVAHLSFGPLEQFPLLKTALFEINIQSSKIVDNISTFLKPQHVKPLAHMNMRKKVREAEQVMCQARAVCKSLGVQVDLRIMIVGRLDCRVVAWLAGRGQQYEGRIFKDLEEIQAEFLKEAGCMPESFEMLKKTGLVDGRQVPEESHVPGPEDEEDSHDGPESLAEMKNPAFQIAKLGYKIDSYIHLKNTDDGKVYKITCLSETEAHAELVTHMPNVKDVIKVQFTDLLKLWGLYKKKMPVKTEKGGDPLLSKEWQFDAIKGICLATLHKRFGEQKSRDASSLVDVWLNPACVRASVDIPKNKLQLSPASLQVSFVKASGMGYAAATVDINGEKKALYVHPHSSLEKQDKLWKCPFWLVGTSMKPTEANLELHWWTDTVNGVEIRTPKLTNPEAIKAGDLLVRLKPKSADTQPPAKKCKLE